MPSTRKTPNYALSQYDGTDVQKRVDGNDDMSKIDTALKGLEDTKSVKGESYGKIESGSKIMLQHCSELKAASSTWGGLSGGSDWSTY